MHSLIMATASFNRNLSRMRKPSKPIWTPNGKYRGAWTAVRDFIATFAALAEAIAIKVIDTEIDNND